MSWNNLQNTQEKKEEEKPKMKIEFKSLSESKQNRGIKIQRFLRKLHIEFYTHHWTNEINHKYQCDIFIPKQETEGVIINQKTIIECDGCYWHGCPICNHNPHKNLGKQKIKDTLRTQELQEKGFRVIRLWEHEIKQMDLNDLEIII